MDKLIDRKNCCVLRRRPSFVTFIIHMGTGATKRIERAKTIEVENFQESVYLSTLGTMTYVLSILVCVFISSFSWKILTSIVACKSEDKQKHTWKTNLIFCKNFPTVQCSLHWIMTKYVQKFGQQIHVHYRKQERALKHQSNFNLWKWACVEIRFTDGQCLIYEIMGHLRCERNTC